ncbi:PfkB family carbohydrate kinase [Nocardioides cheoyonin]|uniref:PfkB family carbohydrate kinase n=1 Tax=Nocardioides cheoyonin TaxID=3156615 RepID=UPI0032B34850
MADVDGTATPEYDVFLSGTVFLDIVFTGMLTPPSGGHEVWTDGMGSSPGGVANLAVACARLGMSTALAAAFGGDVYGDYCWNLLADGERIDLAHSRRFEGWHSPVTVSLAFDDDRAMVTHGHPPPVAPEELVAAPPPARLCFFDAGSPRPGWLDEEIAAGAKVFADAGWDSTGSWDTARMREQLRGCYAFVPNSDEAMRYTQTDSPGAALEALREFVPFAVVTAGSGGAFAADNETGETAWAPGVPVEALDPTGAGDVFLAALMLGTLREWPLLQRLRFANLCAALSVRDFGGALAAPGWGEVAAWWAEARQTPRMGKDYAFLDEVIPAGVPRAVSRAAATIGLRPLPPLPTEPSMPDQLKETR